MQRGRGAPGVERRWGLSLWLSRRSAKATLSLHRASDLSREPVTVIFSWPPWVGVMAVTSGKPERGCSAVLLFWDLLLGQQASGLTHPTVLSAGQAVTERLSGSHTQLWTVPAQPSGDQPELPGQSSTAQGVKTFLQLLRLFLCWGKKAFLSLGQITKQIVPASPQRPVRLGNCSSLLHKA